MQKTTILIFSFLLLCFSNAFAQGEERTGYKGPVKQVISITESTTTKEIALDLIKTIEQFDAKGRLIHERTFYGKEFHNGSIRQYTDSNVCWVYSYNEDRRIKEGDYRKITMDSAGRKIAEYIFAKGKLFAIDSIVYDSKGRKIKEYENNYKKKDSLVLKFTFDYDSLDRLVLKTNLLDHSRHVYTYMLDGNYVMSYEAKDGKSYKGTYTVNDKGQLIRIKNSGMQIDLLDYDEYGNWLQQTGKNNSTDPLGWRTVLTQCQIEYYSPAETDSVYLFAGQQPEFPGGQKAMFQYIADNAVCPLSASKNGFQGRAMCQFVVNKSGDLADITVVKSSGNKDIDNEAVRIITTMPKWTPGRSQGEIVRSKYTIPVTFKIAAPEPEDTIPTQDEDTTTYTVVEVMPEFPDGQEALFKFLSSTIRYPSDCQEKGIQGTVIVQFVVAQDGRITDIKVVRSSGNNLLDEEALRVVKAMPKWKPGMHKGKPVRVKYTTPINFILE